MLSPRRDESVMSLPQQMSAVTIDRFGGPEVLQQRRQQVPEIAAGEVLIKVAYAGVGAWDPLEREGVFVEITGEQPKFPFTPGGDGSGTVVAVGALEALLITGASGDVGHLAVQLAQRQSVSSRDPLAPTALMV